MKLGPFAAAAADLAPGDLAVLDAAWDDFAVQSVRSSADPAFEEGWGRLWREFGDRGEMETRDVIASRLARDPARSREGWALLYEMLLVRRGASIVAVRDHSAIVAPGGDAVVVHLSHVLVEPELRGSGLASWLRALPVGTARRCIARATSLDEEAAARLPVTLVAEMDRDDGRTPAIVRRLRSYAKAGFSVVDPRRVDYHQPDFRRAADIDASSSAPVPLSLVLRRVGREGQASIGGGELAAIVDALYTMYGADIRGSDIDAARRASAPLPGAGEQVALLVPESAAGGSREAATVADARESDR